MKAKKHCRYLSAGNQQALLHTINKFYTLFTLKLEYFSNLITLHYLETLQISHIINLNILKNFNSQEMSKFGA